MATFILFGVSPLYLFCLAAHHLHNSGRMEAILYNCDLEVMCCNFNYYCIAYSIPHLMQLVKYLFVSLLTDNSPVEFQEDVPSTEVGGGQERLGEVCGSRDIWKQVGGSQERFR